MVYKQRGFGNGGSTASGAMAATMNQFFCNKVSINGSDNGYINSGAFSDGTNAACGDSSQLFIFSQTNAVCAVNASASVGFVAFATAT